MEQAGEQEFCAYGKIFANQMDMVNVVWMRSELSTERNTPR